MRAGNLYYWFASKQALIAYCQQEGVSGLLATARWARALDRPADTRFALILVGHVRRLNEWSPGSLAHLEAEGLEGEARTELLAARARYAGELEQLVREGIEGGVFRPLDARIAVLGALGTINWTVRWFRPGGPLDATAIGLELAEIQVRGLLAAGRTPALPSTDDLVALQRFAED